MVFVQRQALRQTRSEVNTNPAIAGLAGSAAFTDHLNLDLIGNDRFRSGAVPKHRRIGYIRVSTERQQIDRQVVQLEQDCDELRVERISAVASERPVFDALLEELSAGDTFVVVDLDRAFRSAIDALLTAEYLRDRGICFDMLTFPIDVHSEMGEVFYGVLALFAQFERRIIRRRTREGLEAARRRGVRLGRPSRLSDQTVRDAYAWMRETGLPCRYIAALLGVPRLTLQRSFHRLGLTYPIETNRLKGNP